MYRISVEEKIASTAECSCECVCSCTVPWECANVQVQNYLPVYSHAEAY